MAAFKNDVSISEYVGDILERNVPDEASTSQRERRPVTNKTLEEFDQISKQILQDRQGKLFEGTVDLIRQQREERLREHTDQLYGAILSYEGKPGGYQMAYIDSLKRELADVTKDFEQLLAQDLPALNESLKTKGQQPIPPPPAKVAVDDTAGGSADGSARP